MRLFLLCIGTPCAVAGLVLYGMEFLSIQTKPTWKDGFIHGFLSAALIALLSAVILAVIL